VLLGKQSIPVTALKVTWVNTVRLRITAPVSLVLTLEFVLTPIQDINVNVLVILLGEHVVSITIVGGLTALVMVFVRTDKRHTSVTVPLDFSVKIVRHVIIATIRNVLVMVPVITGIPHTRVLVIQDTREKTVNTLTVTTRRAHIMGHV
jgi:hypothetical protein